MKTCRRLIACLIITTFLFPSSGIAADVNGLFLWGNLLYERGANTDSNFSGNSSSATSQGTYASVSMGYIFSGWAYVGGTYNQFKVDSETRSYGGSTTRSNVTYAEYGPSFGFMDDSWHVIGTYLLGSQKDNDTDSGLYSRTGGGYLLNVGYALHVSTDFLLGPSLMYRMVTYVNCKDPNSGGTFTCSPVSKEEQYIPFFSVAYNFH